MKEENFERGLLGQGGQVDRGGGRDEFEVSGDRWAADSCQGAAEDEFQSFAFDFRPAEVMAEVVEDGTSDLSGERPCVMACKSGSLLDG